MKMSLFVMMFICSFSISARADYFKCEIEQMGTVLASQEAEYRVLEASASADGFVCEGRINSAGETQVKLTELATGRSAENSVKGSQADTYLSTVPRHNEYNIICDCGMN